MTEQIIPIEADEIDAEITTTVLPQQAPAGQSRSVAAVMKDVEAMLPIPNLIHAMSKTAIASFVLGLLTIWTFGLSAVPAIIFGHIALTRGRGAQRGRWMAIGGLVFGYGAFAGFGLVIFGGLLYAVLN